jgi:hypothetical protein
MLQRVRRQLVTRLPVSALGRASALRHGEQGPGRVARRHLDRRHGPVTEVTRFDAGTALADALALVLDALEGHQVPHAVLEAGTLRRRSVVVTDQHAGAARAALAATHPDRRVRVAAVAGEVLRGRAVPASRAADRLADARVLRVFRVLSAAGTVLAGPELGCDLEFWPLVDSPDIARPDGGRYPVGTALAPRLNRWVTELAPAQRVRRPSRVDGRAVTTYPGLLADHLLDVRTPVDAVYTWVDGDDPGWRARREATWDRLHPGRRTDAADPTSRPPGRRPAEPGLHELAANEARYTCHDELRYSLRSLAAYAPWVRRVYLVTDGQVPPWLAREHPGLTVVDHRDLLDAADLPTFNSHAIEACLHRVPGLAEHYLYLNDDVFFGRPVRPETFFHGNGLARFFDTDATIDLAPASAGDKPVASAAKNGRAELLALTGRTVTRRFQHVAHPQRRSVLERLETELPQALARTRAARFRSPGDVSVAASLAHYAGYAWGQAVPGRLAYTYCDLAERRAPLKLQRLLRRRDQDMFCLNEVTTADDTGDVRARLRDFLDAYYPTPSRYEVNR